MKGLLLLLVHAAFAGLVRAQCSCGCSDQIHLRPTSYVLPPPMHYPMCTPPHPSMMPCYQPPPPPVVVPLPPPPKGFSMAKTTVQQHPMIPQAGHYPGFHPGPNHPPICVQSVYVGKKEGEEDDSCCKKGKKSNHDDDCATTRRRRSRRQRRRYLDSAYLRSLLDPPVDPYSDSSDPDPPMSCDDCPRNSAPRIVYIDNQ